MFEFFYSLTRKDKNEKGLFDVLTLAKKLSVDRVPFEMVHIAGTNGKGSVATMLHATSTHAGISSGLFTSPHITHPKERIKVGDEEIEENQLLSLAESVYAIIKKQSLDVGFFGIMLMCALWYFKEKHVEIAFIEAGIGGLLDSTNIITSMLSIITTIGEDHIDILGRSEIEIAKQKAGIIRYKTPVVLGSSANRKEIIELAQAKLAPTFIVQRGANFIEENEKIAKKALDLLSTRFSFTMEDVQTGLQTKPKARFEKLEDQIYLDAAHNLDAIKALVKLLPKTPVCVCLSFSKDKNAFQIVEFLKTRVESLHVFHFEHPRAMSANTLKALIKDIPNAIYFSNFEKAFDKAKQKGAFILITGSFYFMDQCLNNVVSKNPI
ncbi:MAG: Bifunctional protein FolC [Chlamydiae bacterium]|nr:Bifunctional protein FolC [Chlamydiota bacterium]